MVGISEMKVSRKRGLQAALFLINCDDGTNSFEFATEAHGNDVFDDYIRNNVEHVSPVHELKTRNNLGVFVHQVKWKNHAFRTFEEARFFQHLFLPRATLQSSPSRLSSSDVFSSQTTSRGEGQHNIAPHNMHHRPGSPLQPGAQPRPRPRSPHSSAQQLPPM